MTFENETITDISHEDAVKKVLEGIHTHLIDKRSIIALIIDQDEGSLITISSCDPNTAVAALMRAIQVVKIND